MYIHTYILGVMGFEYGMLSRVEVAPRDLTQSGCSEGVQQVQSWALRVGFGRLGPFQGSLATGAAPFEHHTTSLQKSEPKELDLEKLP